MSRYIDADALVVDTSFFDGGEWHYGYSAKQIESAPTVDAIERLMDEIDRKDKALQAWVKTWESRKENAIRHICDHCDTPIDVRLKEGACEDCPIKILIKEIFDEQP